MKNYLTNQELEDQDEMPYIGGQTDEFRNRLFIDHDLEQQMINDFSESVRDSGFFA